MTLDRYAIAMRSLLAARASGGSLSEPFRRAFDVAAAGIATLRDPFGSQLVSVSGEIAAACGELQIDLGEGPTWDAYTTGRPILSPDFSQERRWPILASRMVEMPVGSLFAFRLRVRALPIGALCLYSDRPRILDAGHIEAATALAGLAAKVVLERAQTTPGGWTDDTDTDAFSLREVHQATGIAAAQLGVAPDDALVAIRAHAFTEGRSVREVAHDLVEKRLDLSHD